MYQGWIKLHRKILDSAVFENPKILKTWIWCLCKASHQEHELLVGRQVVNLESGQFVFGRKAAAESLNIAERTIYDYMQILKQLNMISIKSNNKFSVVTVENWSTYQLCTEDNQQQITNSPHSNLQADCQDTAQQINTNKNENNLKMKESKNVKKIIADLPAELQQPVLDFMDMRKSIKKPMTEKALKLMLSKLNKMSNEDIHTSIEILNQSTMNSWQGIFPLKADQITETKTEKELKAAYKMMNDWGNKNV